MQIHLSDVTDSEGKIIQFSSEVELDKISFQMGEFPILDRSPVELRIANTGNKVLELTGKGSLTVGIPCDRCLEQVSVTIPYDIDRKLDMKQTDKERVENLDENDYLTGMDLDVDRLVYLEVLMSWPLKVLCKEDCKGICSRCGKNLNEGPCGCAEEPKDPRMAAISDIFSKFKEVEPMSICPKNKSSKARRDKRRANWKMSAPNLVKCSKCGALMMPHRVCKECGSYNKKEIVKVED